MREFSLRKLFSPLQLGRAGTAAFLLGSLLVLVGSTSLQAEQKANTLRIVSHRHFPGDFSTLVKAFRKRYPHIPIEASPMWGDSEDIGVALARGDLQIGVVSEIMTWPLLRQKLAQANCRRWPLATLAVAIGVNAKNPLQRAYTIDMQRVFRGITTSWEDLFRNLWRKQSPG